MYIIVIYINLYMYLIIYLVLKSAESTVIVPVIEERDDKIISVRGVRQFLHHLQKLILI